ncbi:hypothetical protein [Aquipuribacter sp. SD81]|uniref:hypothetical protein n=1 Tax=Aquipuribacter sp. SD81 TaxID=3127703 RepID=UPI003018A420
MTDAQAATLIRLLRCWLLAMVLGALAVVLVRRGADDLAVVVGVAAAVTALTGVLSGARSTGGMRLFESAEEEAARRRTEGDSTGR